MATTTRGAPSGTASVPGRNGNGVASWIAAPETSEIRYTSGGRTKTRFATSCAAPLGPQPCGLVVMVFGLPNPSIDQAAQRTASAASAFGPRLPAGVGR